MDGEFQAILPLLADWPEAPEPNLTAANEHVPQSEQRIRVVKERVRATRHRMPYSLLPLLVLINLVLTCGRMLNNFPARGGGL